jgi:hypothetical protein
VPLSALTDGVFVVWTEEVPFRAPADGYWLEGLSPNPVVAELTALMEHARTT